MRYRTQSANVLNEADRFQAILDWQLFHIEQNARMFYHRPGEWTPGDPMYQHPHTIYGGGCMCDECIDALEEPAPNYEGNTVRPMIQEFIDGNAAMDPVCPNCEVSWSVTKAHPACFICERDYSFLIPEKAPNFNLEARGIWRHNPVPFDGLTTVDLETFGYNQLRSYVASELMREMGESWRTIMNRQLQAYARAASRTESAMRESFRGVTAQFVIYDEMRPYAEADVVWSQRLWLNANPVREFHPPTPPLNPFVSPEDEFQLELVPPVAADPVVVPVYTSRAGMRVVEALRGAGPEIFERPQPEVPKFPELTYTYQGNYARVTINTPITQQRRRRNL